MHAECHHAAIIERDLVRDMGVRVVEINDSKLSAVFEIYAAAVLGLPQSFAVS